MNEERIDGQTISWIPLKEASQLIGCSVKTIRRRIKSGSCRSMIEYHGQKAIRLVAREDVLKGTTFLKKLPYGTSDESLAARALEAVHLHLDNTIELSVSNLTRAINTAASGSRTYLLVVLGITTILITALLLFFLEKRGNIIERRMVDTRNDLSTIIVHGQELIGRETANAVQLSEESVLLSKRSNQRIDEFGRKLDKFSSSLEIVRKENSDSLKENKDTRSEISALHREIADLYKEIQALHAYLRPEETVRSDSEDIHTGESKQDETSPADNLTQEETPKPSPPLPKKDESGFLGIF